MEDELNLADAYKSYLFEYPKTNMMFLARSNPLMLHAFFIDDMFIKFNDEKMQKILLRLSCKTVVPGNLKDYTMRIGCDQQTTWNVAVLQSTQEQLARLPRVLFTPEADDGAPSGLYHLLPDLGCATHDLTRHTIAVADAQLIRAGTGAAIVGPSIEVPGALGALVLGTLRSGSRVPYWGCHKRSKDFDPENVYRVRAGRGEVDGSVVASPGCVINSNTAQANVRFESHGREVWAVLKRDVSSEELLADYEVDAIDRIRRHPVWTK